MGLEDEGDIISSVNMKEIMSFVTACMGLEDVTLIKISQTQKYKCCVNTHIWKRKKETEEKIRAEVTTG